MKREGRHQQSRPRKQDTGKCPLGVKTDMLVTVKSSLRRMVSGNVLEVWPRTGEGSGLESLYRGSVFSPLLLQEPNSKESRHHKLQRASHPVPTTSYQRPG